MECRLGEEDLKGLVGDPDAETPVGESGGVILGVAPCDAKGPSLLLGFGTAKDENIQNARTKLGITDSFQLSILHREITDNTVESRKNKT